MPMVSGILPEIILAFAGLAVLVGDSLWPGRDRLWLSLAAASAIAAGFCALFFGADGAVVLGMVIADPLSAFLKIILLGGVFIVILLSFNYSEFRGISLSTYTATLLFSTIGLLLLVSATDLVLLLIAIELLGVGSFVITGYLSKQMRSSEAAVKFFLFGALSTALFVLGLSYYYGIFGNTAIASLLLTRGEANFPLLLTLVLLLAGLGFKLAMAPFHMWVPDAYEGAPTPVTAFLSVAPKAAALGALLRLFSHHPELGLQPLIAFLAALTMTIGNVGAVLQKNIKRLLGYSSIAQMGYVLVGFATAGPRGFSSALIYVTAYLFMNLGAFACVVAVSNATGSDELSAYDGISVKSLPLSLVFVVFLLSLTGVPPLFGFIGKFSVFAAALSSGWLWLAAAGCLNSVISLYYYFRIAHHMYFQAPVIQRSVALSPSLVGSLALCLLITVGFGLAPDSLMALTQSFFR
jgi:NADH-quinone oxidoreductase subunit N